jgi:hypothetical protein
VKPYLTPSQAALLDAEIKFQTGFGRVEARQGRDSTAICSATTCSSTAIAWPASSISASQPRTSMRTTLPSRSTTGAWMPPGAPLDPSLLGALVQAYDAFGRRAPTSARRGRRCCARPRCASGCRACTTCTSRVPGELTHAHDPAHFERILRTRVEQPSTGRSMSDIPREFVFTRYPGKQGTAWLRTAYNMFSQHRGPWVDARARVHLALLVIASCRYVGPYRADHHEARVRGRPARRRMAAGARRRAALSHLFQGFRTNLRALLTIGVFFVVGITLAVAASSLVDGGRLIELVATRGSLSEDELKERLGDPLVIFGMLFSTLLSLPVIVATWWAPRWSCSRMRVRSRHWVQACARRSRTGKRCSSTSSCSISTASSFQASGTSSPHSWSSDPAGRDDRQRTDARLHDVPHGDRCTSRTT